MKAGINYTRIVVCYFCHDGEGRYVLSKRGENARDKHGSGTLAEASLSTVRR